MTTNLSYSTYQNPPSTESLKQFTKHQSDQTESNVMSRKLKVTALVMCFLVLGAFLLSSEIIHRKQNLSKSVSVTTDAPKSIPVYIDTEDGTSETKEESETYIPPVENKVEYVPSAEEEEQQPQPEEEKEESSSSSSSSTVKPAMPDAPTDSTEPVLPPVASLDAGDPLHPRVSNAASMPVKVIRSDARLSPLYMAYATTEFGWLRTLFSKYGFVGNRLTDPKKYTFPESTLSTGYTGEPDSWSFATLYDGSHCGGGEAFPQSVAGLANHMCIPVSGFGGDKGQAIMMDCLENGDVIMNAFNANDCTGAPISSVVLAVADTCYAYSYSLDETAVESDYSASVSFSCGHPELDGYNVEKFFVAFDATSAQYQCSSAEIDRNDGQIFEAFPVDTCLAQRQSDGNAFSLKFGIDDDTKPVVTYCFGSTDCGASNSKLKSASTSLFSDCADQAWQTGISVYGKWAYHPGGDEDKEDDDDDDDE